MCNTVDAGNLANHLGCIQPANWCRISSMMYVCFNRSVRLATNARFFFACSFVSSSDGTEENIFQFYCCFHCEGVTAMITRDMIEEAFVEIPLNIFVLKRT